MSVKLHLSHTIACFSLVAQYLFKTMTYMHLVTNLKSELEMAVGHRPFSNQFQDLADQFLILISSTVNIIMHISLSTVVLNH